MSKRKRSHHPKDRSERRSYRKAAKAKLRKPWDVLATRVNKHGEKKKKSKNDKRNLHQETEEGIERFFNKEIAD